MRKLLLSLLLMIMGGMAVMGQNANRNGFFLEAAFGGTVGTTPQCALSVDNSVLKAHTFGGPIAGIAFGSRFRIGNTAAYELSIEIQAPLNAISSQPSAKLMPLGFRFTSPELYRNFSLYCNIRLGGAIGFDGNADGYNISTPSMPKQNIDSDTTGGAAASIGVGVNVTTHFYAGFTCDMQYLIGQYRGTEKKNCLWGLCGLRLGYRF